MEKKPIYIIFKTHLDIGFTDYAERVVDNYLHSFIPNAIRVGYELKGTDTPFVWTVGSWMLLEALKHDSDGSVDRAIRDGIINWHGLPFTTHTELMNPTLFKYGLEISKELDRKYGRATVGAKMTDVPGHTVGIVPLMADAGIEFLHLGINPATPMPPVPRLFRWHCGGKEIVVMYQGDYGLVDEFEDFAVCFAHTGDNKGPQSKEQIIAIYDEVRERFPGSPVLPGTLNDLARLACSIPHLPVLENEIGDLWIHGVGTDPEKVSRFKNLQRHIEENGIPDGVDLTDSLLLVPEHTWGQDIKKHFPDTEHFTHEEIENIGEAARTIEHSWQEQRDYITRAEALLGVKNEYPIKCPDISGYSRCEMTAPPFRISWQIFTNEDYRRYERDYLRDTADWAIWDNTKVGLPDEEGGIFEAEVSEAYEKEGSRIYKMIFPEDAAEKYGLPELWAELSGDTVTLKWFNKKPNRFPQACFLKFIGFEESWEINKMGQWISPRSIVGAPLISAADKGVRNREIEILTLDSALVAPFGRRLLRYGEDRGNEDMYFNLYNNIWNTNFPMWYKDDAMFRFVIKKR